MNRSPRIAQERVPDGATSSIVLLELPDNKGYEAFLRIPSRTSSDTFYPCYLQAPTQACMFNLINAVMRRKLVQE